MSKVEPTELEERLLKDLEFILPKANTYIQNDEWGRNMANQVLSLCVAYLQSLIQQEKNKLLIDEWRGIKALLLANEHHQDTKWLQDIADRTIAHAQAVPVEIIKGRKP